MKKDLEVVCDQTRESGIFDTLANQADRNIHLSGAIAKALGARASELFAVPPQVQKVEVLANTPLSAECEELRSVRAGS